MLSDFQNNMFVVYKWLGCILTSQMQEHIWNNVQINGFWDICDFVKEKANAF
jgi:hypothetical protein